MALIGSELACELDRLVDHGSPRDIRHVAELVRAHAQDGALHGVELGDGTIGEYRKLLVQGFDVDDYAADQGIEERGIEPSRGRVFIELGVELLRRVSGHLPLVQRLHRRATRAASNASPSHDLARLRLARKFT